jgi:hypothetical protein
MSWFPLSQQVNTGLGVKRLQNPLSLACAECIAISEISSIFLDCFRSLIVQQKKKEIQALPGLPPTETCFTSYILYGCGRPQEELMEKN